MPNTRKVPTTIRDETFPSRSAAARAYDVPVPIITKAAQDGRLDEIGITLGVKKCSKTKPFFVRGRLYKSYSQAGIDHNCSPQTVRRAVKLGIPDSLPPRNVHSEYLKEVQRQSEKRARQRELDKRRRGR